MGTWARIVVLLLIPRPAPEVTLTKEIQTACSSRSVRGSTLFVSPLRFLIECSVKCRDFPGCQGYSFDGTNCTGLNATSLRAPDPLEPLTDETIVYVNVQQVPTTSSTKLLFQFLSQALWTPLPSQMGLSSTCAQPPSYPQQVYRTMRTVVDGRAVYCGGALNNSLNSDTCFALDPNANSWAPFAGLPQALSCASFVLTPSGWWLAGGFITSYVPTSYLYNVTSTSWTSGPALPIINGMHCMVKITPATYLLAGGLVNPSDAWMLDWTSGVWAQMEDLTVGRLDMACFLYEQWNGSKVILAIGGYYTPSVVDIFSLTTMTWTRMPDLASLNDNIYSGFAVRDGNVLFVDNPGGNKFVEFNGTTCTMATSYAASFPSGAYAGVVEITDASIYGCN